MRYTPVSFLPLVIILFFTFVLGYLPEVTISQLWGNLGMVRLNHAVIPTNNVFVNNAEAEEIFEKGINNFTDHTIWRGLGFSAILENRKEEAITAWKHDPHIATELVLWGLNTTPNRYKQNAINWFEFATDVNPQLADAWYYKGIAENDLGNYFSALDAYQEALSIFLLTHQDRISPVYTHQFESVELSDVYFRLGVLYEQDYGFQDVDMALTMYDKALDFGSFGYKGNHAQAYYRRGVIYEEIDHELVKAIAEYRKALDIFPEHGWAKLRLGYALYREYKNVTQAEDILYEVVFSKDVDGYQKLAYQYLGDIYMIENRPLDAIEAYRQVLIIDPNDEKVAQLLTDLSAKQKK